jgi:nicotinamidase-related amidase
MAPVVDQDSGLESKKDWKHTAVLVVDMQNDFVLAGGPLHVVGGAAVVADVKKAVEACRAYGAHVVWVVRQHDARGRDVELFREHLYPDGVVGSTVKGSKGAELVDGLEPTEQDTILVKSRFSAFFATNLDLILRRLGITSVVVFGVQTPNCIRATAFDALALDYAKVAVLADATGAATPEVHEANLYDMRKVGISTPTVDEWLSN